MNMLEYINQMHDKRRVIAALFKYRHEPHILRAIKKLEQERNEIEDCIQSVCTTNSCNIDDGKWTPVENWHRSSEMALWE